MPGTEIVGNGAPALSDLTTEAANPALADLDALGTLDRLRLMNAEDRTIAFAVEQELEKIAAAVESIVRSFRSGGRLIYIGAGTSGRLGVLDAAECPPTFGTDPRLVTGIIAGGRSAMFEAVEGAEDSADEGRAAVIDALIDDRDTVVGISASGQAPYVWAALVEAMRRGAATVAVVNNRPCLMEGVASITIAPIVGPETIAGSTRMKAGTAQKMVLNLLSTNAMIETGTTFGNRMVDVKATNSKLRARALRMTMEITGASREAAELALAAADGSAKLAILMIETGLPVDKAAALLADNGGFLRRALALGEVKGIGQRVESSSDVPGR